jgi:hypothetical protein
MITRFDQGLKLIVKSAPFMRRRTRPEIACAIGNRQLLIGYN